MNGNKIKVLITGSGGVLGSDLLKLLPYEIVGFTSKELDVTNFKKTINILESERPDIIIHTAAYTNVEECEIDPDESFRVNTIGTQNLVNYCIDKDVIFIFISSTGAYGVKKETEPYTEFDDLSPTTIHHKTKYEAEKIIQNHLNKYLILRTGWLFGGDIAHNKNFVYKRYLEALKNNEMYSDDSQIGNPTYVQDLVRQIQILIVNNQYGVFNCVNEAYSVTRYDYVTKIVDLFNLNCNVKKASEGMFQRAANVSKNESAINYKLELLNLNVMGKWEKSLEKYIGQLVKSIL
jgi:dTDP-4-dehydrorhamnose reductase